MPYNSEEKKKAWRKKYNKRAVKMNRKSLVRRKAEVGPILVETRKWDKKVKNKQPRKRTTARCAKEERRIKRGIKNLSDAYVKKRLRKIMPYLKGKETPIELIEVKRQQLKLWRMSNGKITKT